MTRVLCRNGAHWFSAPATDRKWPYDGQPCMCREVKWEKKRAGKPRDECPDCGVDRNVSKTLCCSGCEESWS